jgi:AcrR family transcriptional regulator
VAQAAGIQAPTIYRLFGDKDGLIDAVAEHVMASFVTAKRAIVEAASVDNVDPLDDLRAGWQTQIDFGVSNPALFRLMSDPSRVIDSPAALSGKRVLEARVHRVALAGRLRVSEDRAVALIQSAGVGAIQTLLATPVENRDAGLAEVLYEAVLARILIDEPAPKDDGALAVTVAFKALAPRLTMLSMPERQLLDDWLTRAITALA